MRWLATADDGGTYVFTEYRVQCNDARGPFKGGIRYHFHVSLEKVNSKLEAKIAGAFGDVHQTAAKEGASTRQE